MTQEPSQGVESYRIFSGEYSKGMWQEINGAKSVADLRSALYTVCCRLQELEAKVARDIKATQEPK